MDANGAPGNTSSFRPGETEGRLPGGDREGTGPKAHRSILRGVCAQVGWRWRQKAGAGRTGKQLTVSTAGIMTREVNWAQIIKGV